jgi:hypothetical protein
MSFLTRQTSYLIGTGTVFSDAPTLVDEEVDLTEEGWDTLALKYALRRATYTAEACAAHFPPGTQIGSRKFWITSAKPFRVAAGFWLAEVTCKGWAATKPAKVRIGAAADMQSGKDVTAPSPGGGSALYADLQTVENTPTVAVTYLAENLNTTSNTDDVGRPKSLPGGITVPVAVSIWTALADPIYHYPNDWVLMGSEQDRLAGTDVGLVTDNYRYIRPLSPGGGA